MQDEVEIHAKTNTELLSIAWLVSKEVTRYFHHCGYDATSPEKKQDLMRDIQEKSFVRTYKGMACKNTW